MLRSYASTAPRNAAGFAEDPAIETQRVHHGDGFVFTVDARHAREGISLIGDLKALNGQAGVTVIKKNMVRTVLRLERDGLGLIVKKYHSPGILEALKSLFIPSRAASEWRAMTRLRAAEIPTAQPILFGEHRTAGILRGAYFAATEIPRTMRLGHFLKQELDRGRWEGLYRDGIHGLLARLTAKMHALNFRHGDFHLGNILVDRDGEGFPSLYVIDLHSVTFPGRLSRKAMIQNLSRVAEALIQFNGGSDLNLFLGKYLQENPDLSPSLEALRQEVVEKANRLIRQHLKSRTKRCLKRSTNFTSSTWNGYRINHRRSYPVELIAESIQIHNTVKHEGDPRLLHPVMKNKVTCVEPSGTPGRCKICVKEYRPRPWPKRRLSLFSEPRRAWVAGRGLEVRGIQTPETVALVRGRGREFLMTRFVKSRRLHDYLHSLCHDLAPNEAADQQRIVAMELAEFVKKIHDAGVRHRDLSEQNILVEETEGGRRYFLIDCDTVSFKRRIGSKNYIKNLVQLGHMPEDINVLAKARFLVRYLGKGRGGEWRSLMERVNKGVLLRMKRKRRRYERQGLPDPHPRPSRLKRQW